MNQLPEQPALTSDSERRRTEAILTESSVPATPGLYVIGSLHRRVTFLSQQLRGMNLVWATLTTGAITNQSHVAVVGGGLAGMTVAAALGQMQIKTHLYEKQGALMDVQRGNTSRYVHPRINDWPITSFVETTAGLPFLLTAAPM